MRFVKSIQSSETVQVYFDSFDNKYIRTGGTLASRCNNPGLIRSHSNIAIRHGSIGHCGQYPVFPNIALGRKALNSWIKLKSYYLEPLSAIAQYYSPKDPEKYLTELCQLSGLHSKSTPSQLSQKQFDKLVWAIEEIAGAHKILGDEVFVKLPKIIGKFSYIERSFDRYLIADKRILSKKETLNEVKMNKIDAVIVHRANGTEYLRSRPGYILPDIFLGINEKIEVSDFNDLIRESGKRREGQVIWGFINGLFNHPEQAKYNFFKMVEAVNGERVWGMINNTGLICSFGLGDAVSMEFGLCPEIINVAIEYFHFLISQAENECSPHIIVIAHSEGAMIAKFALSKLEASKRKRIRLWTFGGQGFVSNGLCDSGTRNFINQHDLIVRTVSFFDYRILIVRDQFKDKNLDCVANYLTQEDMLIEGIDVGPAYERIERDKEKKYKERLDELSNTEIIYHTKGVGLHHSFDDPHYQSTLKGLVRNIYVKK